MSAILTQNSQLEGTRRRFWKRQFAPPATTPQIIFDFVFGIIGPILCFVFDPVVFRGNFLGKPMFADYQVFVYLVSGIEIVVLIIWLLFGTRLPFGKGLISGFLINGAILCAAIGCILLPYSLMGLVFVIGILGLTPFASAIVYLRNGYRAAQSRREAIAGGAQLTALLLGSVLALGVPALLSVTLHKVVWLAVEDIIHGDPQQASAATHRLRMLKYFSGAELDKMPDAYASEADPARKQRLKDSYREITGEEIETQLRVRD